MRAELLLRQGERDDGRLGVDAVCRLEFVQVRGREDVPGVRLAIV